MDSVAERNLLKSQSDRRGLPGTSASAKYLQSCRAEHRFTRILPESSQASRSGVDFVEKSSNLRRKEADISMNTQEFEIRLRQKTLEILRLTGDLKKKKLDLRNAKIKVAAERQKRLRLQTENRLAMSESAVFESLKTHYLQLYQKSVDKVKELERDVKTLKRDSSAKEREKALLTFKHDQKMVKKCEEIRRLQNESFTLREELKKKTETCEQLQKDATDAKSQLHHIQVQLRCALDLELTCVICSERMIEPVVSGECGHSFCKRCIAEWIKRKPECPICRARCLRTAPAHVVGQLHDRILGSCGDAEMKAKYAEAVEQRRNEPPLAEESADHSDVEVLIDDLYQSARAFNRQYGDYRPRLQPTNPGPLILHGFSDVSDGDVSGDQSPREFIFSPPPSFHDVRHRRAAQLAETDEDVSVVEESPIRMATDDDDDENERIRRHYYGDDFSEAESRHNRSPDHTDPARSPVYSMASDYFEHFDYRPDATSPASRIEDGDEDRVAHEPLAAPIPESEDFQLGFRRSWVVERPPSNASISPIFSRAASPEASGSAERHVNNWWERNLSEESQLQDLPRTSAPPRRTLVPFHKRKPTGLTLRYSTASSDSD